MPSVVKRLADAKLVTPPPWLPDNTMYEVMMGSVAYGVSDDESDVDVYGFCIPPKAIVFPHLAGEILGFGRQKKRFDQWQQHHVDQPANVGKPKRYDLTVYSIVRYFSLAMENNPNMVDSLFVPERCVLTIAKVGTMLRERRHDFLHKGSWHRFKGYAYSQLKKMGSQNRIGKRAEEVAQYGFDRKFAYHVVRLLYEAEMILLEHDIDLERHREHLKAIKRGDVPEAEIRRWASDKERALEKAYEDSSLRHSPDEPALKQLLLGCLEEHYGALGPDAVVTGSAETAALQEMGDVVDRYRARQSRGT